MPLRNVRDCLQEITIMRGNDITKEDRVNLEVLTDKFSVACPFQPLGIFDLNLSNAMSMAGLSFTYVIVLLQFKIADRIPVNDIVVNKTAM